MKLCIDVGNTTIRIGIFNPELSARFSCDTFNSDSKYHEKRFNHYFTNEISNSVLVDRIIYSSVVPSVDKMIKAEVNKYCPNAKWTDVSIDLKHNFIIDVENEKEIGADLFADLVGASDEYGHPTLIIDIGTATKILLIDKENIFSTCVILPGIELSAKMLTSSTALLPSFNLKQTKKITDAHNTIDCLVNGVIYGQIESIIGIVNRYESELGYTCKKIVTGGAASYVKAHFPKDYIIDDDLIMKGLNVLLEMNK